MNKLNIDTDWLKEAADIEANCIISAGGHLKGSKMSRRTEELLLEFMMKDLNNIQNYYEQVCRERYEQNHLEGPKEVMILLMEEVGELARAIRKTTGMERVSGFKNENVGHEIADVFLYLLHLSNKLGISLSESVVEKEKINMQKAEERLLQREHLKKYTDVRPQLDGHNA